MTDACLSFHKLRHYCTLLDPYAAPETVLRPLCCDEPLCCDGIDLGLLVVHQKQFVAHETQIQKKTEDDIPVLTTYKGLLDVTRVYTVPITVANVSTTF